LKNTKRFYFLFTFLVLIFFQLSIEAQSIAPDSIAYRYWIFFKDKGEFKPNDKIEHGSEAYNTAMSELTDKAIWRRSKVLPEDQLVGYFDIPVNKAYIDGVKNLGLKIYATSKWLNGVSVITTRKYLNEVKKLGYVIRIEAVNYLDKAGFPSTKQQYIPQVKAELHKYNYGISYWQNRQINVPLLHDYGITGYGVTVGMCDDGFNWRRHKALRTRKVLGEYDWIFKDDSTQNQNPPNQFPQDGWDQDGHGTTTFSTLGGFYEGKLIGPAFDAEFYLSKTEDARSETPVEEDYYLEAVEWMEAKGIEVISCSLIYKPFDDPNDDYTYKDMDGKTTVIVRAAEMAAHLGIVVCNSMGNERQTVPPSIVSPPDGDSVIAVGAVDSAGIIANFSSNGPTSDGRTKPDVVAMGVDVYTANSESMTGDDSTYGYSSGTSFSCPLTAGVCALILSAHPELTPMQVREALKNTADKSSQPNNVFGWGLVNAYEAALYWGGFISNMPETAVEDGNTMVSIYVISKNTINTESVKLHYSADGSDNFKEVTLFISDKINETNSGRYSVTIGETPVKFYFTADDTKGKITGPYNAPVKFFITNNETKQIEIF
jgi:serine protease AprX